MEYDRYKVSVHSILKLGRGTQTLFNKQNNKIWCRPMFWFFLLEDFISFQGKKLEAPKEKLKGQQHSAPGPLRLTSLRPMFLYTSSKFFSTGILWIYPPGGLYPLKSLISPSCASNTTVSLLWFPSPALSNNFHVTQLTCPHNLDQIHLHACPR